MKRAVIVGAALLAMAAAGHAEKLEKKAGVDAGLAAFGAYWDTDEAGDGGGAGFKAIMGLAPNLALELRASYYEDLAKEKDDELEVVPLEAGLAVTFPLSPTLAMIAGAGGGYYIMDGKTGDADADPDDEFGAYAIGGVALRLSEQTTLFGTAKYTSVEIDKIEVDGAGDIEQKIDLTGAGAEAGLIVSW